MVNRIGEKSFFSSFFSFLNIFQESNITQAFYISFEKSTSLESMIAPKRIIGPIWNSFLFSKTKKENAFDN